MRAPARLLAAVLLAVLAVGGTAAPASAHATLVSTDPADGAVLPEAPGEVTFTFDESVSLVADGLLVYDAAGEPVEAEASARDAVVTADLPDGLDDGTYVVTWRVVSSDGHPIAGSLTFHVGEPSASVQPPQTPTADDGGGLRTTIAIVQALGYLGLLVAAGLVVFLGWTARGIRLREVVRRRLLLVLRFGAALAVAAAALGVPLAGAYQQGIGLRGLGDAASYDMALVGDQVTVLVLQLAGLGLAVAMTARERATPSLVGDLGAAVAVWSPALVGHTRAYEPVSLLVVTDALHLSAAAVWLGGLVGLVLTLASFGGRAHEAARLVSRFSTVAAGLLAALVVSGVLMAWRILGSWSGLVDTTYGRLLLVKLGIAVVVVAVAAWNRLRLVPAVAAGGTHERGKRASALVRRAVAVEAVLLVALLGVTGFLTGRPPAGDASAPPATADTGVVTGTADDLRVLALLDDAAGRQRRLSIQVQDRTGEPVDLPAPPEVSLRNAEVDLGPVRVVPVASGTYVAAVAFPAPGEWEVQVSLRVGEFENPVTTVTVEVE
ncbi:copper transport protein [Nocardioides thalensis]|uniref:Copper transport protein n=1 Tax=Nocardioides thalensis TaxID=1914755 RepID=A0A853C1U1_9ACTN|nr:copper resistance protein CopC [Nocardioides thalensis]NYJ00568.1 copper transport protein [Nocardioides thalensis]